VNQRNFLSRLPGYNYVRLLFAMPSFPLIFPLSSLFQPHVIPAPRGGRTPNNAGGIFGVRSGKSESFWPEIGAVVIAMREGESFS